MCNDFFIAVRGIQREKIIYRQRKSVMGGVGGNLNLIVECVEEGV
jgi:hypothetical protein